MRPVPSQRVWTLLAPSEHDSVTEMIIRVLTEVVEHERFDQDPTQPQATPSGRLPAAIHSQASRQKL